MDGRSPAPEPDDAALASRIKRLEVEERDAIRSRDWSAARRIALERTALKEARRKALARKQG
jgi:hypothetical protein